MLFNRYARLESECDYLVGNACTWSRHFLPPYIPLIPLDLSSTPSYFCHLSWHIQFLQDMSTRKVRLQNRNGAAGVCVGKQIASEPQADRWFILAKGKALFVDSESATPHHLILKSSNRTIENQRLLMVCFHNKQTTSLSIRCSSSIGTVVDRKTPHRSHQ